MPYVNQITENDDVSFPSFMLCSKDYDKKNAIFLTEIDYTCIKTFGHQQK